MTFQIDLLKTVQRRLSVLGYYMLNIDGVPGPGTENAVTDFKKVNGYLARPFPGDLTLARLFSPDATPAPLAAPTVTPDGVEPSWLTEARRLLGVKEYAGAANNPEIMGWAKNLDQWYPGDDVAWCGLFVAHCMAKGAPDTPQGFNRLGARAWGEYGEAADAANPPLGSILTLWRTHKTQSWNGHVLIVTGQSATAIRGISGNTSDKVMEAWFARDRVLDCRVPNGFKGFPAPNAKMGVLSTNEA